MNRTRSDEYTILGLDLGTNLGWAVAKGNVIEVSGCIRLKEQDESLGSRFLRFYNFLNKFTGVHEIVIEEVVFRNSSSGAARIWCGLFAIVLMFSHGCRIPVISYHTATLKKRFAGHGRAEKLDMCERARALGWKGGVAGTELDNDEADAIGLVYCVLSERGETVIIK